MSRMVANRLPRWNGASLYIRLALSLAVLSLGACDDVAGPGRIDELPRQLTATEQQVIGAGNGFGFDLLGRLLQDEEPDANLFISPVSASMALGMTLNGAAGETFSAMRETLGFGALSRAEINDAYGGLIDLLRGLDPAVTFAIGNSLWHRTGFDVEQEFTGNLSEHFDAEVQGLDFADPAAAGVINDWVAEATAGRIDHIVEAPIDPLTMAFLINAIYFKGAWTVEFDRRDTQDSPFTRPDGSKVLTPFMMLDGERFPFASTADYEAVELPYGGQAFAMTVVLPRLGSSVETVAARLDDGAWASLVGSLAEADLTLFLPKFRLEYEKALNDVLTALGMGITFDPHQADFTLMHARAREIELHISKVKQKSFIQVDEEGTEAAAATSVEMGVTSAGPVVRVDRPFLFAIRERLSGTILFLGRITDPS